MLAAAAVSLHAVDGVILINQAAALNGNVTPGDAPGFPVTILVSGSYRLSSNLTVPNAFTDAIQIFADDVTIDLNGFSIIGPTVCTNFPTTCANTGTGVGINGNAAFNTRVLNGNIKGMGAQGVLFAPASQGSLVEKISAFSNGGDGISTGGIVNQSIASSNAGSGIVGRTVTGSTSEFNGAVGIQVVEWSITNNTVRSNGQEGIRAFCASIILANLAIANNGGDIVTFIPGCIRANNIPAP
jgi:hypothetical protein